MKSQDLILNLSVELICQNICPYSPCNQRIWSSRRVTARIKAPNKNFLFEIFQIRVTLADTHCAGNLPSNQTICFIKGNLIDFSRESQNFFSCLILFQIMLFLVEINRNNRISIVSKITVLVSFDGILLGISWRFPWNLCSSSQFFPMVGLILTSIIPVNICLMMNNLKQTIMIWNPHGARLSRPKHNISSAIPSSEKNFQRNQQNFTSYEISTNSHEFEQTIISSR
jgi:hypothetical protein